MKIITIEEYDKLKADVKAAENMFFCLSTAAQNIGDAAIDQKKLGKYMFAMAVNMTNGNYGLAVTAQKELYDILYSGVAGTMESS
jgi:hypothetical protein